jgi:pyruvate-formate lyase-activating enzyme
MAQCILCKDKALTISQGLAICLKCLRERPNEALPIARFIARIDPEIPYSLLAYYPHFYLADLPFLSKDLAHSFLKAAQEEGLKKVRIGNSHLLK